MGVPTNLIYDSMAAALATDTTTLNATPRPKVALIAAPFTPLPTFVPADLTFATFTGSAPKSASTIALNSFIDPATGDRLVQLGEPAGGWHFECTVTPASPEVIHGAAILNDALDELYHMWKLDVPVTVSLDGHAIDLDPAQVRIPLNVLK